MGYNHLECTENFFCILFIIFRRDCQAGHWTFAVSNRTPSVWSGTRLL